MPFCDRKPYLLIRVVFFSLFFGLLLWSHPTKAFSDSNYVSHLLIDEPQSTIEFAQEIQEIINDSLYAKAKARILGSKKISEFARLVLECRLKEKAENKFMALEIVTSRIKDDPNNGELYYIRGTLDSIFGYLPSAEENLKKASVLAPQNARIQFALGDTYNKLGKIDLAIVQFQKALKLKPEDTGFLKQALFLERSLGLSVMAMRHALTLYRVEPSFQNAKLLSQLFSDPNKSIDLWMTRLEADNDDIPTAAELIDEILESKTLSQYQRRIDALGTSGDGVRFINSAISFSQQQYEQAEEWLKPLDEIKDVEQLLRLRARLYWETKRLGEAAKVYEHLIKLGDYAPEHFIRPVRLYNQYNQTRKAEELIVKALSIYSKFPEMQFEYADILQKRKRFTEARNTLRALNEDIPNNSLIELTLATLRAQLDDVEGAKDLLKNILSKQSENQAEFRDKAAFQIALIYGDENQLSELSSLTRLTFKDKTTLAQIYAIMAEVYLANEDKVRAQSNINKARRILPGDNTLAILEAKIFSETGQSKYVFPIIQNSKSLTNNRIAKLILLQSYVQEKKYAKVSETIREILFEFAPNPYLVELLRWSEARLTKPDPFPETPMPPPSLRAKFEEFLTSINPADNEKLIEGFPKSYAPSLKKIIDRKFIQYIFLSEKESLADVNTVLGKDAFLEYLSSFSGIYSRANSDPKITKRVLDSNPNSEIIRYIHAETLIDVKDYEPAIEYLSQIDQDFPSKFTVLMRIGLAYAESGKFKEGEKAYIEALRIRPNDSSAQNNLAWLYLTSKENSATHLSKATELAEKATGASPSPENLDTLAEAYYQGGRYEDALFLIERALVLDQSNTDHYKRQYIKIKKSIPAE